MSTHLESQSVSQSKNAVHGLVNSPSTNITEERTRSAQSMFAEEYGERLLRSVERFLEWLECYGETTYDPYDFWATSYGRRSRRLYYRRRWLGTAAVSPLVFLDLFFPASRRVLVRRKRYPIGDAHFASGFTFLRRFTSDPDFDSRAVHFLEDT